MKITMQIKFNDYICEEEEISIKDYKEQVKLHLRNKREKETKQLKNYNEIKYKLKDFEIIYKLYKETK